MSLKSLVLAVTFLLISIYLNSLFAVGSPLWLYGKVINILDAAPMGYMIGLLLIPVLNILSIAIAAKNRKSKNINMRIASLTVLFLAIFQWIIYFYFSILPNISI